MARDEFSSLSVAPQAPIVPPQPTMAPQPTRGTGRRAAHLDPDRFKLLKQPIEGSSARSGGARNRSRAKLADVSQTRGRSDSKACALRAIAFAS